MPAGCPPPLRGKRRKVYRTRAPISSALLRGGGRSCIIRAMQPIEIPARAVRTLYRVPYADTDMMGYVYYGNYLTLFERARNELMRATGRTYAQMESEGGAMLPVIEAHVNYHSPARYDDLLAVDAWVEEAKGFRIRIRCVVTRDGQPVADGHTVHVCVDAATRRPVRVPPDLVAAAQ